MTIFTRNYKIFHYMNHSNHPTWCYFAETFDEALNLAYKIKKTAEEESDHKFDRLEIFTNPIHNAGTLLTVIRKEDVS